ncbi:substrate-binding domain-containing protein [Gellertiella hungarica]|uniref:LacI family transcriptional regulator n=1 Tax=Gellertiella hungarica TaxID=1572859 RepID=A0A7W6NLP5_9HYPH|nr:substrate-binding domain-containing protein [Gellertiella hungarica]MBB4065799.1 LacI family transcriptional regulator [Gellertiella hungarica]
MVTLKDVARSVGLSVTQVSRALNDHSDVNEETRRRVKEAAGRLGYEPNISARKLVSGRSGIVALVDSKYPGLTSDFLFFEIVAGLSAEFSRRGMQFVLHVAEEDDDIIAVYQKLVGNGSLDGFVVTKPVLDDRRISYLASRKVPFVVHGRLPDRTDYPHFDIDNRFVAVDAVTRFLDLGHRRIGFINGIAHFTYSLARYAGYRETLSARGLPVDPALVRHGQMTEEFGYRSALEMLTAAADPPTAIFCSNVLIAAGVYRAASDCGLRIPADLSVIAHDDALPNTDPATFEPPLSVTYSPLSASWPPLAEYLTLAIAGQPLEEMQQVARHQFVERASTAPQA